MNQPNRNVDADYASQTTTPPGSGYETPSANDGSVGGLVKQLTREVPNLFIKELALAKAEIGESVRATKQGAISLGAGAVVLMAGLVILLQAAVYGLAMVLQPWAAAAVVGGVTVLLGLIMVSAGKRKFQAQSFRPERTLDSLHKDKDALRGRTS